MDLAFKSDLREPAKTFYILKTLAESERANTIINYGTKPWVSGSCSNKKKYLLNSLVLVSEFIIQK